MLNRQPAKEVKIKERGKRKKKKKRKISQARIERETVYVNRQNGRRSGPPINSNGVGSINSTGVGMAPINLNGASSINLTDAGLVSNHLNRRRSNQLGLFAIK